MFGDPRLPDRFWAKVMTEPNTGCWLWTGHTTSAGFGHLRTDTGHVATHRLAFAAFVGSREDFGSKVFQSCGEKSCCNPDHLYAKPVRNRARTREYQNAWQRKKLAEDEVFKAKRNASHRDWYARDPAKGRDATRRWQQANQEVVRASAKRWQKANPDKVKAAAFRSRLRKYGISETEYAAIIERQSGGCGICKVALSSLDGRLIHIDHCHSTGRVRGVLCTNCNTGIGQFNDDEQRLLSAVAYLKGGAQCL